MGGHGILCPPFWKSGGHTSPASPTKLCPCMWPLGILNFVSTKKLVLIATVGHYGLLYISFLPKSIYVPFCQERINYFTTHKWSIETVIKLPDSSTKLIIATSRHCGLSMCRSRLSKAANPNVLLKNAVPGFCHSEFVYNTGSVYFT